jgi:hypothetical protein
LKDSPLDCPIRIISPVGSGVVQPERRASGVIDTRPHPLWPRRATGSLPLFLLAARPSFGRGLLTSVVEPIASRRVGVGVLRCTIGDDMLNPWLTLSLQTVRLGWETHAAVVHQMMRIAGAGVLEAGVLEKGTADPDKTAKGTERGDEKDLKDVKDLADPAKTAAPPANARPAVQSSPTVEKPARRAELPAAAQKATIHKKRSHGRKRHRSK